MINKAKANFESIKKAILANMETLRNLFDQAKNLNEIVEGMSDQDSPQKKEMEEILKKQFESIDSLLSQTDDLFEMYYKFLKELDN